MCRTVPTIRILQYSEPQGNRSLNSQLRNFSRRWGFITCSAPSASSIMMRLGRLPFHCKPRTSCSEPLAMIQNWCPSNNSTTTSVSVSLINRFTPNWDLSSSLTRSSVLMLARNRTTCPSVLETKRIKSRSRKRADANVPENVTAVVLAVPRGAATTTLEPI